MQQNNIENWKYFILLLVRKATIGRKANFINSKAAYLCFEYELINGREFWELFKRELRENKLSLNDIEKQNYFNDLKTDFYPVIDNYFNWFNQNKNLQKLDYYNIYQFFFEFCNDTKNEIERIKPKKDEAVKPVKTGFKSSLTDGQIQALFDLLKGRYIDINTNPDHFKAIFRTNPLPPDFVPVKRTKQFTGTLLAYFVSKLFQKENQSDYWSIAEICFDEAKSLRQSFNNAYQYNPDRKPKGYNGIDTILTNICTHLQ